MADFIPPIVVDIISRSAGFAEGVEKAKADMADLSAAATDSAAATGAAMDDAKDRVHDATEGTKSDFASFAADVANSGAVGSGVFDDFAADVHNKAAVAGGAMEDAGKDAEKSGGHFKRFASAAGSAFSDLGGSIGGLKTKLGGVGEAVQEAGGSMSSLEKGGLAAVAVGLAAAGYEGVKMGSQFQQAMTQLVTGAGESEKNIAAVGNGVLAMAAKVGQTPAELAKGLYLIESAGYHGAAGLTVLKSAAEGAATGNAQMSDVANVLTTAMHDYAIPAGRANAVTSALIETVALGKTHLGDLSTAMASVMPVASSMGVSFQNVTGAMSTMTLAGMKARRAGTDLAFLLRSFGDPGAAAQKAMDSVGIKAQGLKDIMSKQGLGAALAYVQDMIGKKLPAGSVAATQAFSAITGGATGYSTALMLTGKNAATFNENSKSIGKVLDGSARSVQGFSKAQKDLAFQWDQFKAMMDAIITKLGMHLIPLLEKGAHDVLPALKVGVAVVVEVFKDLDAAWKFLGPFHDAILAVAGAFTILTIASMPIVATIAAAVWPFLAVIAAIVAVVEVVKHFGIVEAIFKDVWGAVESIVTGAVHAVASVISSVLGAVVGFIEGIWHDIEHGVTAAWDWIKSAVGSAVDAVGNLIGSIAGTIADAVSGVFNAAVSFGGKILSGIINGIGAIAGDVGNLIAGVASTVWNAATSVFTAALHFGEKLVEGIGHALIALPKVVLHAIESIPIIGKAIKIALEVGHSLVGKALGVVGLAEGAVVAKPTLALIGEGSEPEAVLPLSQLRQLLAGHQGDFYPARQGAGTQQKAGGLTIENLNINGRSRTDAQIVNDMWLRLRPYLTAPAY
jgi:TP901 family phage tail tape measure protein